MTSIWKNAFEMDLKIKKKKKRFSLDGEKREKEGCFWPRAPKPTGIETHGTSGHSHCH